MKCDQISTENSCSDGRLNKLSFKYSSNTSLCRGTDCPDTGTCPPPSSWILGRSFGTSFAVVTSIFVSILPLHGAWTECLLCWLGILGLWQGKEKRVWVLHFPLSSPSPSGVGRTSKIQIITLKAPPPPPHPTPDSPGSS